MLQKRAVLSVVLLAGSIVVVGYPGVNGGSSRGGLVPKEWTDGSPLPIPKPTAIARLAADGSPLRSQTDQQSQETT